MNGERRERYELVAMLGSPDEPRSVMVDASRRDAPIGSVDDTALLLGVNDISSLRWERSGIDSSTVNSNFSDELEASVLR